MTKTTPNGQPLMTQLETDSQLGVFGHSVTYRPKEQVFLETLGLGHLAGNGWAELWENLDACVY